MSILATNLELIRRVPLFSTLTVRQAEALAQAAVKCRFKRGQAIVEQGKKSDSLAIILTGRARVMTTDTRGREAILATMEPGDYIGEMSLIDNEPHSATVRALVRTDVLILGRSEFARFLPDNSSVAYAVMKKLVQRLRQANRQIESLSLMDVYGRVARALLEFAVVDADGNTVIRDKLPRKDLAKMVGASREMVSRAMKDLQKRGFIVTHPDGSMIVKDRLTSLE